MNEFERVQININCTARDVARLRAAFPTENSNAEALVALIRTVLEWDGNYGTPYDQIAPEYFAAEDNERGSGKVAVMQKWQRHLRQTYGVEPPTVRSMQQSSYRWLARQYPGLSARQARAKLREDNYAVVS